MAVTDRVELPGRNSGGRTDIGSPVSKEVGQAFSQSGGDTLKAATRTSVPAAMSHFNKLALDDGPPQRRAGGEPPNQAPRLPQDNPSGNAGRPEVPTPMPPAENKPNGNDDSPGPRQPGKIETTPTQNGVKPQRFDEIAANGSSTLAG